MKKYIIVDYLKGFAILTIVIYHLLHSLGFSGMIDKAIQFGGTGVHAFLLISGFGLYLSYSRKPLGYLKFLQRRLSKVYLPYIIIVLLTALLAQMIPFIESSWYALAGHIFLFKMFDNAIIGSYGGHFWFISTIIQFYLIFHLLAWYKSKSTNSMFMITGIAVSLAWGILITWLGKAELRSWNSFFLQYIWEFMLGMVIADAVTKQNEFSAVKNWKFLLLAVVCLPLYAVLALKAGDIGRVFNDIPALLGYLALAVFVYQLNIKFVNGFFVHISTVSYPLFLIHILVNTLLIYFLRLNQIPINLLTALVSLIISYLLAHLYTRVINSLYRITKL